VNWVVVTRTSYEAWETTTDATDDADLRLEVLGWVLDLQRGGPPSGGIFDPFRDTLFTQIGQTGVWIE